MFPCTFLYPGQYCVGQSPQRLAQFAEPCFLYCRYTLIGMRNDMR